MISVIIPVHNAELYLKRCIESVLANTYKDLEIILVENGSSDGSLALCQQYERQYENVKLLVSDRAGVSHARNLGLDAATGEYIAFVDADDYVSPYMYETLLSCAETSGAEMAFCDAVMGKEEKKQWRVPASTGTPMTNTQFLHNVFMASQYIYSVNWNKLYRKDAIKNFTFNESLRYTEDREFNVRVICSLHNLFYIDEPLCYYFRGNENAVSNDRSNMRIRMDQVYSLQKSVDYIRETFPEKRIWLEFAYCSLLQTADFRLSRAKMTHMIDLQEELRPIIYEAAKKVRAAKHISFQEKTRILLEHDSPWLFSLLARLKSRIS